jgi:pyruvate formate lyase activating enzyme
VDVCPSGALFSIGKRYTVAELLSKVQRDSAFYSESGGGVTLSGGEPVLQFDFVLAFLKACKEAGLNTAIETSGFMPKEKYAELLPFLDHIYFDLKLMKSSEHKQWTGANNDTILENARWLVESKAPVIFRVPLINGMTAIESNTNAIGIFLKGLDITKVELCPYQDGWEKKLTWLAAPPLPLNMPTMSTEDTSRVIDMFSKLGITAQSEAG